MYQSRKLKVCVLSHFGHKKQNIQLPEIQRTVNVSILWVSVVTVQKHSLFIEIINIASLVYHHLHP